MTSQEQDCIRWCYVVAGFTRTRLARDFGTTMEQIDDIVSGGLGRILNPAKVTPALRVCQINALLPQQDQWDARNLELYRRHLGALADLTRRREC